MRLKFIYTVNRFRELLLILDNSTFLFFTRGNYAEDMRLTVLVMALFSILLFIVIIGPEASSTIAASSEHVDSLEQDVVDSSDEATKSAIEKEEPTDVTSEITYPKVGFQLKYNSYPLTYTYLLVQNESIHIRKGPSTQEPVLRTVPKNEKLNYIETVTNEGKWYHVTWAEKGHQLFGFVNADVIVKRVFQFDKMHEAVQKAEKTAESGPLTYINNYHNLKGYAPLYQGEALDQTGGRQSQSAPGYPNPADLNEFSYLGDGTLVRVLSTGAQYTRVALVKDEGVYYVPNKYVVTPAAITAVKKAVVIDRANQNEAVFEKIDGEWKVISYTLATTGTTGNIITHAARYTTE